MHQLKINRYNNLINFSDKGTERQRGSVICPRFKSQDLSTGSLTLLFPQ